MKKINLFFILILILSSCTGMKEAGKILRNEKITSTDEFLVKKRNPLVLPPKYNCIKYFKREFDEFINYP